MVYNIYTVYKSIPTLSSARNKNLTLKIFLCIPMSSYSQIARFVECTLSLVMFFFFHVKKMTQTVSSILSETNKLFHICSLPYLTPASSPYFPSGMSTNQQMEISSFEYARMLSRVSLYRIAFVFSTISMIQILNSLYL